MRGTVYFTYYHHTSQHQQENKAVNVNKLVNTEHYGLDVVHPLDFNNPVSCKSTVRPATRIML